jgi:hypothetical protein
MTDHSLWPNASSTGGSETTLSDELRLLIDSWVAPLLVRKYLSQTHSKQVSGDAEVIPVYPAILKQR